MQGKNQSALDTGQHAWGGDWAVALSAEGMCGSYFPVAAIKDHAKTT